jgi:hypothetical protein
MKNRTIFFFVACCVQVIVLPAQEFAIFTNNSATWDGKPLTLAGKVGYNTQTRHLSLSNRSRYQAKIHIHTHSDLDFVYFADDHGNQGNQLSVNLPSGSTYKVRVFGYLKSGGENVYNDDLGLDVEYLDQYGRRLMSNYWEYPVSVYFRSSGSGGNSGGGFSKPEHYDVITINGLPARWHISDLPLKLYSNHRQYGYSTGYEKVLRRTILVWNNVAESIGLSQGFFELTSSSSNADIQIDWSGQHVERGAMGVAYYTQGLVAMLPMRYYQNEGAAAETLLQELCHMLGPEHSGYSNDIMFGTVHGHSHDLSEVTVTDRDRQMLGWLYSLRNYYPFR